MANSRPVRGALAVLAAASALGALWWIARSPPSAGTAAVAPAASTEPAPEPLRSVSRAPERSSVPTATTARPERPGVGPASAEAELDPGDPDLETELRLAEGSTLVVRVRRHDGLAAAGVRVFVQGFGGVPRKSDQSTTDARGECRFAPLHPGRHYLQALPEDRRLSASRWLEVAAGRDHEWEVFLDEPPKGFVASGRVLDEAGAGLASVALTDGDGVPVAETDEDGAFVVLGSFEAPEYLHPEPFAMVFEPPYVRLDAPAEGLAFRRVATLEERTVRLRVVDASDGSPVTSGEVRVDVAGTSRWIAASEISGDGRAGSILAPRPSERLTVWAPGYETFRGTFADARTTEGTELYEVRLAPAWPERIELRREGYQPAVFEPRETCGISTRYAPDRDEIPDLRLLLDRADDGSAGAR